MDTDDVKSPLHKKSLTNNNHFAMNEAYVRKPRNERQTRLVIVLFFLLLLLLVLLIVMVTLYVNKDSKMKEVAKKHNTTACSARDCVQISASKFHHFIAYSNHSFVHSFVCAFIH